MSDGELLGASRKRAASTDLEAVVASAMEGADVSLVSQGDADAIAALEAGVVAVEGDDHAVQAAAEDALALGGVGLPDASMFDKYTPELARWLDECRAANGGGEATHDDVFFFFETTYPEVLDHLPQLFHWITVFMDHLAPAADASPSALFLAAPEAQEAGVPDAEKPIPSWVPDAVLRLEATGDLATIATECGLKSPVTLLYWKNEHAKRELQREHDSHRALDDVVTLSVGETEEEAVAAGTDAVGDAFGDIGRHRTAFMREDELSEWLLSHQYDQLTRQDVINHVVETYPAFAATKSPAALKVWTSRFLKRHLASNTAGGAKSISASKSSSSKASRGSKANDVATDEGSGASGLSSSDAVKAEAAAKLKNAAQSGTSLEQTVPSTSLTTTAASATGSATEATGTAGEARPATSRKRRGVCTGGYVLHSNEFKLNALRKLDEGKSVSEVAQELGLKSQNSLTYWNSIRDKLVTSEKKRFRLAGGGRRSSCTFEGELLMWVSERHQKGLGTDVKAVLDYMREFHSSFTEGKKEPTLRKWILRFFKRCWRAPTTASDPQDTTKAYIFTSGSVGSVRRKKRASDRAQACHSDKTSERAPAILAPVSDVKPSDLLKRLLLPRVNAVTQQPRGHVYFSSMSSPAPLPSTLSAGDRRDTQDSCNDALSYGRRSIGNQERDITSRDADAGSGNGQGRRGCAKTTNLLAFQQKYGKKDALIDYALRVMRDGLMVRRTEIPRDKNVHYQHSRDQRTPEDALYLVYCPAPPCGFRNVYWLTFIEEQEAVDPRLHQRDYFTLTCRGLTHFEAGAAAEFVDIASWVDEKRAFDHMTSMRGLERIQQMLFFFSWKRKAIKNKHKRVQARLRESLFICHAVAARVLRRVRVECLQIEEWTMPLETISGNSFTVAQFHKLHQEHLAAARSFIHAKIGDICGIISYEACLAAQPATRKVSYTLANLASLTSQLEAANLRERLFPFLRLAELQVAEAVRAHSIAFLRGICRELCGESGRADESEPQQGIAQLADTSFLYAQIVGAINTDEHVSRAAPLEIRPTKDEVFELLHSILARYLSTMDDMPRLLMDTRFQHMLTPFEPTFRTAFCRALTKPSSLVFEACAVELARMRDAVDACYQRVERIRAEHLRCTLAIKVAESKADYDLIQTLSSSDNSAMNTSSATAHEAALKTWNRFLQYAAAAGDVLHVGFLVVDQQKFICELRDHVARHLAHMNELLPREYQALLQSLVDDVDARIDRVTRVPGNLESAMIWIGQVTEMLPTHPQRQHFDAKCRNLARLKALVKARAAINAAAAVAGNTSATMGAADCGNDQGSLATTLQQHEQQLESSVRKLEVAWESLYETLLLCLERVQDRNGVHRRSLDDLTSRTEEYIGDQLHQILTIFAELPTGIEEEPRPPQPDIQTQIVNRLEELVELDMERSRVVTQYAAYEREYRMVSELTSDQWATTLGRAGGNRGSMVSQGEKLPTEMLLQYVVTALELRQWYAAWSALRAKWEASPVVQVHPGAILDRIKQFRKRLMVSARRMNRLSTALLKTPTLLERAAMEDQLSPWGFATPDHALVRAFRTSINDMAWFSKVFQAVNGGSFADRHWEQLQGLLNQDAGAEVGLNRDRFALQQLLEPVQSTSVTVMREKKVGVATSIGDSGKLQALIEFFDDCIVESRLHAQLERSRHRLSRVRVHICEENYSVRCDGVDEALRELDSILMDVKLCLYQQNPELQDCMEMCAEVERHMAVCEYILQFQRKWLPMFDLLKLHDVEEFVASQQKVFAASNSGAGSSSQTDGCSDSSAWKAFTSASQRWADCMRRIYFTRPQNTKSPTLSGPNATIALKSRSSFGKKRVSTNLTLLSDSEAPESEDTDGRGTSKKRSFSLDEITHGFQDFNFELEIASCEHGMALMRGYLSMLRDKSPRLLLVEDLDLLHLLTHDQDIPHFHRVLTRCFPHVSRFSIKRYSPHYELDIDSSAPTSDSVRITDEVTTSVLVDGIMDTRRSSAATWSFRIPVTKIGRVKFWLSRIEEEMVMMVRWNVKTALQWIMSSAELYPDSGDAEESVSETENASLPPPQLLLLPQAIAAATVFRFSYELARRWIREENNAPGGNTTNAIHRLDDLSSRQETRMSELITVQRDVIGSGANAGHTPRAFANIENLLLLLRFQAESLRHITQLLRAQREEDARFFWALQYKVHFCQLSATNGAPISGAVTGGRQTARAERIDLPSDFEAAVHDMKRRDLEAIEMYAQVAHIELAIGHEFTGWSRVPILSPLSQRCAFALFSAVRACKTPALITPYSGHSSDYMTGHSAVTTLAQLLMTPLIQLKCSPGTSIANGNFERLEAHLDVAVALNAVLVIHDFALLGQPSQRMIQERLLRRTLTDRTAVTHPANGANTSAAASVGVRFNGGPPLAGPAVIIPFTTHQSLQRSGLLDPIQHQFRSVAVPPVAISYLVESLLLPHGYSHEQVMRTGAIGAFESLATSLCDFEGKCGVGIRSIIPKVVGEAMRLRASYRVMFMSMLDGQSSPHSPSPQSRHRKSSVTSQDDDSIGGDAQEQRVDQTVFRVALLENIELLLASGSCDDFANKAFSQFAMLLDALFPYASRTRTALSLKRSDPDDAVANAVEICLEESGLASSNSHLHQKQQLERIMDLWKILQVHDSAIVHGPAGSGKSTSIKVLHRALTGLALASKMDGEDAGNAENRCALSDSSKLTVLNAGVLSLDQLHVEVVRATRLHGIAQSHQQQMQQGEETVIASATPPRWIFVDGALDSALLDRVMALSAFGEHNNNDPDERDPAALVTRRLAQSVHAGGSQMCSARILFEAIDLCNLSPSSFTRCANIYMPATCISYEAIVLAWKCQWQQRLRVTASTDTGDQDGEDSALTSAGNGSQRLALLFKTVDTLLSGVCVPFVEAENAHQEQSKESFPLPLAALGGLSINHMTSTALTLLALWSFPRNQLWHNDSSLLPSPVVITELAAFAVLWGFTGHMPHAMQHKLEFFLRTKMKDSIELRHLSDAPGSLFDASRFDEWSSDDGGGGSLIGDPWPMQTPSASSSGGAATEDSGVSRSSPHSAAVQRTFDPSSGHLIVLQPVALPLIRICSQLVHAGASFMLIGPVASGKTSLLRWLLRANDEAQTAEMMIDRALDQRQAHGVLDWLMIPASWFKFSAATSGDSGSTGTEQRVRERRENELFPPQSACSFVFVDDLSIEDSSSTVLDTDSSAKVEFLRSILDHGICFNAQRGAFLPVSMQVGAAMRLNGDIMNAKREFPSAMARLLRHFVVLHTPEYSQKDLLSVFRTKFHAHFDPLPSSAGPGASNKPDAIRNEASSTALTAPEVVLRASADWMAEISGLRDVLRAQGVGCADAPSNPAIVQALTFNWHHLNVILSRSLAFARELSCASTGQPQNGASTATGGGEPQTVTLVELGRLHQSWLSELQNVFLVNWLPPSLAQPSSGSDISPTTTLAASSSDEFEIVSKKLWAIVRLLSEKYFSAALQDEQELPVSIASAYFSLRLTDSHTQAPLLQMTNAVELRELLTALASSAPSVGAYSRSTRGSVAASSLSTAGAPSLVTDLRKPIAERIVTMLIEMSRSSQVSESNSSQRKLNSSPYYGHGTSSLPADLELRLLLNSPSLLTQSLHIVHALGQSTPQSPLLMLSARHGLALARRLANFACSLHGFQVQQVGATAFTTMKRDPRGVDAATMLARGNGGDMHTFLADVLFAVGVRHKRIALWVDWRDLLPTDIDRDAINSDSNHIDDCTDTAAETTCDNDAVSLLLALIEEICLGQIPTLVLDKGRLASGAALRDAIVMGCIHDKRKMDTATEAQLLRDFCLRIQRNLRICIFDTGHTMPGAPPAVVRGRHNVARARLHTLRAWMSTRPSCVWLQLDIRSHQVGHITTAMAEQAAALTTSLPRGVETTGATPSLSVPRCFTSVSSKCLIALHHHVMSFATPPGHNGQVIQVSPEHSVEYFLSFIVNLSTQWRRVLEWETNVMARYRQAVERFDVLTSELLPRIAARRVVLDKSIRDLSEEAECADTVTGDDGYDVSPAFNEERETSDVRDEALSVAEALAQREYDSWCRRSEQEERGLMRCELEMERQTLALFMSQWQHALPHAKSLVVRWQEAVKLRQTVQFWNKRLGETILRVVGVSYSFVWSLQSDYKVAHLKATCMAGIKQILNENELYPPENPSSERQKDTLFPSERNVGDETLLDGDDSGEATLFLGNLLMAAELPLLRHGDLGQVLRAGFDVADRMPVFVDSTGIFQRLFVKFFSDQPLLGVVTNDTSRRGGSALRAGNGAPATSSSCAQSQHSSSPARALIVSSNAPDLRSQLAEAQRLNMPVLLVDFRPDNQICAILSPFLDAIKRRSSAKAQQASASQPLGLLARLAVESYHIQAADRNSRRTNRRTASVTIGSATAVIGAGAAPRPSIVLSAAAIAAPGGTSPPSAIARGRRNSIDRRMDHVAALAAMLGQQSVETGTNDDTTRQRHGKLDFQIVAVTSTTVDLSMQHQRSHEYAFYALNVDKSAHGRDFFSRVWLAHTDREGESLQRGVREAERLLADCYALVSDWRDKLWAAIGINTSIQPTRLIKRDSLLPLASTASTLEYYEHVCDTLVALAQQERRLAMSCEQLQQKKAAFDDALASYSVAGMRMASLGCCISVLPVLLPPQASILYKRSYRWLEYRVIEELAVAVPIESTAVIDSSESVADGRDSVSDGKMVKSEIEAAVVSQRIATSVGEDLISQSHRQLLLFLESVERAATLASASGDNAATSTIENRKQQEKPLYALFLWRALSWMSSSELALASGRSTVNTSSIEQQWKQSQRQLAESATGQSVNSLVDRFRCKVRLGALLMDCFSGNSRTNPAPKDSQPQHGGRQPMPIAVQASPSAIQSSSSSSSLALFQDAQQRHRPFPGSALSGSSLALNALDTSQKDAVGELESTLAALFTVIEDFWLEWKAAKLQRRRDVERLLAAHGVRRARHTSLRHLEVTAAVAAAAASVSASPGSTAVSDGTANCNSTVRVKSLAEVLAEFSLYDHHTSTAEKDDDGDGGRDSIANSLAKLLLSYSFFPDQLAEAAAGWCELVMSLHRTRRPYRQSSRGNGLVATVPRPDQSDVTPTAMDRENSALLLDFGTPSPLLVALVSDVSPSPNRSSAPGKTGKSHLVLLPKCLLVYLPSTGQSAQRRAEKCLASMPTYPQAPHILIWWRSSNQTPAADEDDTSRYYYDELVALVTSTSTPTAGSKQGRRFFAVNLLDSKHFDAVVAMISRVVNDHALLAVPEWALVCSLDVAMRITSSKLSLIPRVFVKATGAVSEAATVDFTDAKQSTVSALALPPGTTVDDHGADAIAENLGWLQSGLTVHDKVERELVHAALMRCLLPRVRYQNGHEDVDDDHRQSHTRGLAADLEATSEQPPPPASSLMTSSAALSSDLAVDIAVARHSILSMVHESGCVIAEDASSLTQVARDNVIQRITIVFDSLKQTADALDAVALSSSASSPASKVQLFPWLSLQREVETQSAFFRTVDTHLRTFLSPSSPRVDPTHSATTACLSRGLIPLKWVASALDHVWKSSQHSGSLPCWPLAQIAVAQLTLLLAYRFALLADWLSSGRRRLLTRSLDLAGVYDARGLLRDLKLHFAKRSSVSIRDVTLALVKDDDEDDAGVEGEGQAGLGAAISRQRGDTDAVVVGLRVEGVVLLELERSSPRTETSNGAIVAFHSLPPCCLVCRLSSDGGESPKASDGKEDVSNRRRVPLVVLASLSSFLSQSNSHSWTSPAPSDERVDWVELEIEPSAVGISLQQQQQQNFDRDEGINSRDDDGIGFALGIPLFATDDDASSTS